MAISFVGYASGNDANGGTATANLNSLSAGTTQTDDVVVVAVWNEQSSTDINFSLNEGGWTKQADVWGDDNVDANLGVFTKVMGGTPDTSVSYTGTSTGGEGVIIIAEVWRGVDTTTPMDAAATTSGVADGGNPDAPSITTVTNDAVVIAIGCHQQAGFTPTVPTNYSNQVYVEVSGGGSLGMVNRTITTAGAENPGAWTNWSATATRAVATATLALRPASASSGNPWYYYLQSG